MPWTHPTVPAREFRTRLDTICVNCGADGSQHYVTTEWGRGETCPIEYPGDSRYGQPSLNKPIVIPSDTQITFKVKRK